MVSTTLNRQTSTIFLPSMFIGATRLAIDNSGAAAGCGIIQKKSCSLFVVVVSYSCEMHLLLKYWKCLYILIIYAVSEITGPAKEYVIIFLNII